MSSNITYPKSYTLKPYIVYHITIDNSKLPPKNSYVISPSNYIGSTTYKKLLNGYSGSISSKKYKTAWKELLKYNKHSIKKYIISFHDTRTEAYYAEEQLLKLFNASSSAHFVNMTLNVNHTKLNKDKRVVSQETRRRISENHHDVSGQNNPMYGRTHSEKSRKQLSDAHTGKVLSDYTKNKISTTLKTGAAFRGCGSQNKNSKKYIITYPDGSIIRIHGLRQFCKENNLCSSTMTKIARGRCYLKTHKGFTCKYDL